MEYSKTLKGEILSHLKKITGNKGQINKNNSSCNVVSSISEYFKNSYFVKHDVKNNSMSIPIPLFEEFCNSALQLSNLCQAVFGKSFICTILKNDIINNTRCSLDVWTRESSDSKTVEDFLRSQIEIHTLSGIEENQSSGVIKFLWVVRSINFIFNFIENIIFVSEESLYESILDAYNRSLRPYHGFTKYTIAMMAIKLVPNKTELINNLGFSNIEAGINALKELIFISRPCITHVDFLLQKYNCNFKHIV
ncbi:glycolipid transfer protein [Cryptosporidium ryanae]|uniref:glycolipid transfer protein n=1 Tax=Cryptosporidium ryanae TaxID=515981 RepID=UPI003519EA57|nr:glycolipid transfer protein [Cryptosporidium ryanae]